MHYHLIIFLVWAFFPFNVQAAMPVQSITVADSYSQQILSSGITDSVVQLVLKKALIPPNRVESSDLITKDLIGTPIRLGELQSYLKSFDKWATFTTQRQLKSRTASVTKNQGGIGMAVIKNKIGDLVCIPYPNSPADRAGIIEGDVITGINSIDVVRKSLVGPLGSTVTFMLERKGVPLPLFVIKREKVSPPHVQFVQHNGFARIRIWSFEKNTSALFVQALKQAGNQAIVIDVRKNSGGNILAARNCAAELVYKSTLLGISKYRKNEKSLELIDKQISTSRDGTFAQNDNLIIWQDELTASAAEAFIVALVDNGRATNMGTRTFGKAHAQSVFNINNNKLTLTTESLLSPMRETWDDEGIMPMFVSYNTSLDELVLKTKEFLSSQMIQP